MKKLFFLCLLFFSLTGSAQTTKPGSAEAQIEMADGFRADGKIYIVVTVVLLVLLGIFIYLFMLEKKLAKIEKELNKDVNKNSVYQGKK
jgi:CcmD family protein